MQMASTCDRYRSTAQSLNKYDVFVESFNSKSIPIIIVSPMSVFESIHQNVWENELIDDVGTCHPDGSKLCWPQRIHASLVNFKLERPTSRGWLGLCSLNLMISLILTTMQSTCISDALAFEHLWYLCVTCTVYFKFSDLSPDTSIPDHKLVCRYCGALSNYQIRQVVDI